jgi:hypothetical protein
MIASSFPNRRLSGLAATGLAALLVTAMADPAAARSNREREPKRDDSVLSRPAGVPLMAIVSLGEQRVTIYDAEGRILRAPISTGQTGYETPAGIYSVIQKEAEHYSNLYDDASMPFMQRITWSGIALHAGALPGYPASHGCIRMPHGFAERLFDLTSMGLRVIVVPTDVTPADIAHPALFKPRPISGEVSLANPPAQGKGQDQPMRLGAGDANVPPPTIPPRRLETLKSIAAAKAVEAEAAAKKADEARSAAAKLATESARLVKAQRLAEGAKQRAEALLKSTVEALAAATLAAASSNANPNPTATERAEEAKTKAQAKLTEAQAQLDVAKVAAEPKVEALARAREEAKTAETVKVAAATAAKEAAAKMSPVSVFISRQTQRLYVRQAFQPIFDTPITIKDADKPIGTHVYTALDYVKDGADVRWSAVSMTSSQGRHEPESTRRRYDFDGYSYARRPQRVDRNAEPVPADVGAAKAALDRLSIPQEAIDRISEVVSPGSALIISDEAISKETGKGTDFVVVMSGEPQGGIKIRQRPQPWGGGDYERPYGRSPYGRSPSFWW